MVEFESTFKEKPPKSTFCVVYDQRDGRIVHMHEFIGDDTDIFGSDAQEARERIALDAAKRQSESKHLHVLHTPTEFRPEPEALYRVALPSGKLVTVPRHGISHREFVTRRRKTP